MQKQFKYIYNGKEVDREEFEKLSEGSFKWFTEKGIESVPFSSFNNFFNGEFKSGRQINDHLDSVLNVYQNKVTEDIINKPKCSPQCYCDGSCKKPQEKNTNSTRHKSQNGETHKEIVGDLEGINRPPSTHNGLQKYINELQQYKDDVITSSSRGEKETMEYLNKDKISAIFKNEDGEQDTATFLDIISAEDFFVKSQYKYASYFNYADKSLIKEVIKESVGKNNQGLKYNNLKPSLDIVINRQFPKALQLIALATEYGHKKYIENDSNYLNYKSVKGGSQTYFDASARHSTDRNGLDESGLPHIIHAVWSSLAGLELWVEENNINVKEFTENFMKNLHNSK